MAALEMLVAEDGAAHNGQVRVGAHKVVGESGDKVQKLLESGPVNDHGHMLTVEDDAVLVIVNVGGVLQEPFFAADGHGDNPVVSPGGVVHPSGVALIFPAELALGIAGLGGQLGGGDGLGVLLGLTQVDGNVQIAVLAFVLPADVLCDPVGADVVRVPAEGVVPVRSLPGGKGVLFPEGADDLPGHGGKAAHNPGVENVPGGDVVVAEAGGAGVVQESGENRFQVSAQRLLRGRVVILAQNVQKAVAEHHRVLRLGKAPLKGVGKERIDAGFYLHASSSTAISTPPWGRMERT